MSREVELVEAALRTADELGIPNLSLRKVAAAAYMSPPAAYRYVDSLDDLLTRCRLRIAAELDERLRTATIDDAAERLGAWAREHPGQMQLLFDPNLDPDVGLREAVRPILRSLGFPLVDDPATDDQYVIVGHLAFFEPEDHGLHLQSLADFHARLAVAPLGDLDRWMPYAERSIDDLITELLSTAEDDLLQTVLAFAVTNGRFPSRRELAEATGRPLSKLYPDAMGIESRVNDVLTMRVLPAMLGPFDCPLARFWSFLFMAGQLGQIHPSLLDLVMSKPLPGRSRVETELVAMFAGHRLETTPEAFVCHVLGGLIRHRRHPPPGDEDSIDWTAHCFDLAAGSSCTPPTGRCTVTPRS